MPDEMPPDQLLDVHAICDERDRLRAENAKLRSEHLHDVHLLGEQSGENAKLREALSAAVAQIEHLEELRCIGGGPTPATLTPDILADARKLL